MNLISKFVDTVLSEHTWPRAEGRRACLCMYVWEGGGRTDKGLCGNKVRARGGNSPRRPPLASRTHGLSVFHGYNSGQYHLSNIFVLLLTYHNII